MRDPERHYDELVGLCYDAVLDGERWPILLGRLAEATGRQQGALLSWNLKRSGGQVASFYQLEQAAAEDYNSYYCNLDPTREFMQERAVGHWYHDFQELGAERIRKDPYYQEYKRRYNMQSVSAIKVHKAPTSETFLSLVTNRDAPSPGEVQCSLLQRITPHLVRAANIAFKLQDCELELEKRNLLLDRHPTPLWLLEVDGRVAYCNAAAEQRMRQAGFVLHERFGRLHSHRDDSRLQLQIQQATGRQGAGRASRLRLSAGAGQDVLITPVAAEASFNQCFQKPLVLVAFVEFQLPLDLLADLFQFSPAERRLAGLLCLGHSPEHCATALNVSINTVRSQLRSLFRKTDTERQAELVGLLMRMRF